MASILALLFILILNSCQENKKKSFIDKVHPNDTICLNEIEKAKNVLDLLKLSHRMNHLPSELSGGEQQRVEIARALLNSPKLVLADEPTGNLDSRNGNEVMELLTDLHAQGATILMVTHSDYDASFSQKTIVMKDGMIISEKNNSKKVDVLIS